MTPSNTVRTPEERMTKAELVQEYRRQRNEIRRLRAELIRQKTRDRWV